MRIGQTRVVKKGGGACVCLISQCDAHTLHDTTAIVIICHHHHHHHQFNDVVGFIVARRGNTGYGITSTQAVCYFDVKSGWTRGWLFSGRMWEMCGKTSDASSPGNCLQVNYTQKKAQHWTKTVIFLEDKGSWSAIQYQDQEINLGLHLETLKKHGSKYEVTDMGYG